MKGSNTMAMKIINIFVLISQNNNDNPFKTSPNTINCTIANVDNIINKESFIRTHPVVPIDILE